MKIALVGNSKFADFWARIINKMNDVEVYAIYGSDKTRNVEFVNKFNLEKQFTDLDELGKDESVDLAIISSVPSLHVAQSKILLKYGKHVLVEKPPALNFKDFKETAELAEKNKLKYAVDFMMRFDPFYELLSKVIMSKMFGEILKIDFINLASDTSLQDGHWFWNKTQSGGIFIEHGVHFFDIYNSLLGKPKLLFSNSYKKPNDLAKEDHVFAVVEYLNKVLVTFTHIFNRPSFFEDNGSTVYFEHGKIRLNGWYAHTFNGEVIIEEDSLDTFKSLLPKAKLSSEKIREVTIIQGEKLISPIKIHFEYEEPKEKIVELVYTKILENFIESIHKNTEPLTSFNNVQDALKLAEDCKLNKAN